MQEISQVYVEDQSVNNTKKTTEKKISKNKINLGRKFLC